MLVSEIFLLMILNGGKGKIYSRISLAKSFGLAGAMILDLGLKGSLSIYGKRPRIMDFNASGEPFIDKILVYLYNSKRQPELRNWLYYISRYYKKSFFYFFQRLENHGILSSGFNAKKYYLKTPEVKQTILEQIYSAIFKDITPNIELLCLLSLIKACRLIKVYFVKEYRKYVERRIDELIHSKQFDTEIIKLILNVMREVENQIISREYTGF